TPELIICDTSLLILFEKIKKLDLLRLCYKNIFITPEISAEFGKTLPAWIEVKEVKNQTLQQTLTQLLGVGESSAIALCFEIPNALVAIDDLKARKVAKSLKLKITGSLGVLIKAKENGHVDKLRPLLKEIEQTDFRISENIIEKILKVVGE